MNVVVILAGGIGSRLGEDIPKQYIEVGGKPIFSYCLERFDNNANIDDIIFVASKLWIPFVQDWIHKCMFKKISAVIDGGSSRHHSIVRGLQYLKEHNYANDATVIIHDAARPGVSDRLINNLIEKRKHADCVLPVLPMKDTIFVSKTAERVDGLLNRNELFAGQTPEAFHFGKYYEINADLSEEEMLTIRGSSEIAYKNGLEVSLIPGEENNYKITTKEDLTRFVMQTSNECI